MSAAKDSFSQIEELFVENAKGFLTYEKLVKLLDKAPTATVVKKIEQLAKTNKVQLRQSHRDLRCLHLLRLQSLEI